MKKIFLYSIITYIIVSACTVSYKFNNAKLDYSLYKTIAIADFPNNAALVYPSLYSEFNSALKDYYSRQTRLQIVQQNGDYNLEGAIVGYSLQQMAVGADNLAAETKLTMTVRLRFSNNINPSEDFERTFSAFRNFSSSQSLESVQPQLVSELIEEIIDQIFNATVAGW
ncbi:MAG: LPS assembly lipoprotein LptE [Prevotellaceae bacterium]|nr:LPS assembly lipoprotein LptE [Prevotellaceae bacterium]